MIVACNDVALAGVLTVVKRILLLIQIIAPILLIIAASVKLTHMVKNPDDKKKTKIIINSFIAAMVIFLIPVIVNVLMLALGENTNISSCWNNAKDVIEYSENYIEVDENKKKPVNILENSKNYEKGIAGTKLNYSNAVEVPDSVLVHARNSDPSIVIAAETGEVLAERKAHVLREGASTTKVFTGYAAVKLLDVNKDKVSGSNYITDFVGEHNNYAISAGQTVSVKNAATRGFPGSSNSASEAIAVAIGYKKGASSDKDAHIKGIKEINSFIKKSGCKESNLGSASGLSKSPMGGSWFGPDGFPHNGGNYGHTANDLTSITITAMKNSDFLDSFTSNNSSAASKATNKNNNGLFYIKSGTGYLCHGIWGFNHNGKRYYIAILGITCKTSSDDKISTANDLYNWSINNLIK